MQDIHPFYGDLLNILYDRDHYKLALGQMNMAKKLAEALSRDYVRLLKYGESPLLFRVLRVNSLASKTEAQGLLFSQSIPLLSLFKRKQGPYARDNDMCVGISGKMRPADEFVSVGVALFSPPCAHAWLGAAPHCSEMRSMAAWEKRARSCAVQAQQRRKKRNGYVVKLSCVHLFAQPLSPHQPCVCSPPPAAAAGDSLYRCKQLKRAALGRMCTLLKRQKASLSYLEEVRRHLARLPALDPNTRTLLLTGFPNVGKSSFMNKVRGGESCVCPVVSLCPVHLYGGGGHLLILHVVAPSRGRGDRNKACRGWAVRRFSSYFAIAATYVWPLPALASLLRLVGFMYFSLLGSFPTPRTLTSR